LVTLAGAEGDSGTRLRPDVALRRWAAGDLPLLVRLLGDPAMTEHLGGPDTLESIRDRHKRYLGLDYKTQGAFVIVVGAERSPAGNVCFWETPWLGETVWECGWSVLVDLQRNGVATSAAALLIAHVRALGAHRFVHAFPSVDNVASNAVCRQLGFVLLGETEVEYPKGSLMRANDWRLDLRAAPSV
jgi:RimJ/RimL family protein N-acetyltransferase